MDENLQILLRSRRRVFSLLWCFQFLLELSFCRLYWGVFSYFSALLTLISLSVCLFKHKQTNLTAISLSAFYLLWWDLFITHTQLLKPLSIQAKQPHAIYLQQRSQMCVTCSLSSQTNPKKITTPKVKSVSDIKSLDISFLKMISFFHIHQLKVKSVDKLLGKTGSGLCFLGLNMI